MRSVEYSYGCNAVTYSPAYYKFSFILFVKTTCVFWEKSLSGSNDSIFEREPDLPPVSMPRKNKICIVFSIDINMFGTMT